MMLVEVHPMRFSRLLGAALGTAFLFLGASGAANAYDRYDRWDHERERAVMRHERHEAWRHEHWRHERPVVVRERPMIVERPMMMAPQPMYMAPMMPMAPQAPSGLNLNFNIPLN